mmetsp:Transcript_29389/g.91401  ORF Transcript_29389/g.91401 Transcript_29389/m.91401 type:complete len:353 (+) Transcript_29389:87-1145(+)|eukprot:CAMPEP_0204598716 /NCGR_PEP_ID=MMETSP0661-20131031/54453_1 /ASSEMBLY_ACC=CAM_ASM_000606 /TAXON_ID=109239 /ORGANISM="Alexandrium margalefi, Strain AMGDE01CS-322" /LENGTH=352 /DNA_ID=CAMNT_0051609425 /DNA_START=78 /DNA_END=1136 /DNA_ORIENTATION=+
MRRSFVVAAAGGAALLARARALRISGDNDTGLVERELPGAMFVDANIAPKDQSACSLFSLHKQEDGGGMALVKVRPGGTRAVVDTVIGVITNNNMHEARAHPHFAFHSKQLTSAQQLLYFTNEPFPEVPIAPWDNLTSTYTAATQRYLRAWRYVAEGCHGLDYKWYFQMDDDAVVSIPRLQTFLRALEPQLGSPYTKNAIVGRKAWWAKADRHAPCGEVYGGSGILGTRRAMREIGQVSRVRRAGKLFHPLNGDSRLSALAHVAACTIVQMNSPFGLGTEDGDEIYVANKTQLRFADAAISLHKVKTQEQYREAELFFSLPGAGVEVYLALLDKVRWQYNRTCTMPKAIAKR